MSRMRRVLEVDPVARRAVVEPGVTNLSVTQAAAPYGLFYAPDPSSPGGVLGGRQRRGELRRRALPQARVHGQPRARPGDRHPVRRADLARRRHRRRRRGYDLLGAFTGSEGTLGIVTKVVVKLTPAPEAVHLVLAAYDSLEAGGRAVTDIIAAGIVPAAIEMMDALSIEAAEAAVHCGYPEGASARPARRAGRARRRGRGGARDRPRDLRGRGRARDPGGRRPRAAGRDLGGPQVRVRRGRAPVPRLHRAGRRGAAHGARRRAGPDRQAVGGDRHPGRERVPRRRREPASAGALQRRGARRGGTGGNGLRRHPRRVHRVRRVDHRRARRRGGQVPVHAEDVQRRRTWTPCSSSAAPSTPRRCATRARSSPPRGCAARSLVTAAVHTPPRRAARRSFDEIPNGFGLLSYANPRVPAWR